MGDIPVNEWNRMTIEERVDACYNHYMQALHDLQQVRGIIDMNDFMTIKTILGVLTNIRGD